MDPNTRPTAVEAREMPFFQTIDWSAIQTMVPPFVPTLSDPTDTGYFEAKNIVQHLDISNIDS